MILKIYLPNKKDKMHFYRLILSKSQENDHFQIIKKFRTLKNVHFTIDFMKLVK